MARILSIDYGLKRIGVALSDPSHTIASPLTTLQVDQKKGSALDQIKKLIAQHQIERIVIGLPLHLSGDESTLSSLVRTFSNTLEQTTSLPVVLWDERLTSKEVERILIQGKMKRKHRSHIIDRMSATLLLQNYLDCQKSQQIISLGGK